MMNAIEQEVPGYVDGYDRGAPFARAFAIRSAVSRHATPVKIVRPGEGKLVDNLAEVFEMVSIEDDMTLSFRHYLRNGDG